MDNKYCTKCGLELPEKVKFCPNCGASISDYKNNISEKKQPPKTTKNRISTKSIIVVGVIVLILIIAAIVAFSIINSVNLQNDANSAKSNINVKISHSNYSDNLGNFDGNICAGSLSVAHNNNLYFCADDGIYKKDNFGADNFTKENSIKVTEGKYSSLNYINDILYAININNNKVVKISQKNNNEFTEQNLFTPSETYTLQTFGIFSDKVCVLSKMDSHYRLSSISLKSDAVESLIYECESINAWMNLSENNLRLCVASSGGWYAYSWDIDGDKVSKETLFAQGTSSISSVAFSTSKIYVVEKSTSDNQKIVVLDKSGNRQDINPNCKIIKLLKIDDTVFIQSSNKDFSWFNTDSNMVHKMDNSAFFDEKLSTINYNNNCFCVVYEKGKVISLDIKTLS